MERPTFIVERRITRVKALVITRPGGPEVLRVEDRPIPAPTGDQVLVRVRAAGVNRADLLQRAGHYPAPPDAVPDVPGMEFAGVIETIGSTVTSRSIGQRVFGLVGGGAQAEFVLTRESLTMLVPDALGDVEAGGVPEAFITAYDALFAQGTLVPGERVLVHAVGSGVGIAAMQLAKASKCTVFGTSRSQEKLKKAQALGLDVAIDASSTSFEEVARDVNLIIDFIGAPYFEKNLAALATRGRLVIVSTLGGPSASVSLRTLMMKRLRVVGTVLRSRSHEEKASITRDFSRDVVPLFANGTIEVPVDRVFALEEAADAHRLIAGNANFGKVVFRV